MHLGQLIQHRIPWHCSTMHANCLMTSDYCSVMSDSDSDIFLTQISFNSGCDTDAAAIAADFLWDDNFEMSTNEDSNIMQVSGARQRPEPDCAEKVTISTDHNSSASLSVTMSQSKRFKRPIDDVTIKNIGGKHFSDATYKKINWA